jgi:hypothetical protein
MDHLEQKTADFILPTETIVTQLTSDQIFWLLSAVTDSGELLQDVPASLVNLCLKQGLVANGPGEGDFRLTAPGRDVWRELRTSRQRLRMQTVCSHSD